MFFNVQIDRSQPQYFISTEVVRNTPWRQVSSGTQYDPSAEAQWKNKLERDSKLVSTK